MIMMLRFPLIGLQLQRSAGDAMPLNIFSIYRVIHPTQYIASVVAL
jgi:hypothetical protein